MIELPVRSLRFYTPELFEISLERGDYSFETGECAVLFNEAGDSRPYSMASAPGDAALSFLVRRMPNGALSDWLADRKPGDIVRLSPPFGEFRPSLGDGATVLVATGVGVSPFLSLLRSLGGPPSSAAMDSAPAITPAKAVPPQAMTCLYGVRYEREAVELSLLQEKTTLQLAVSREPDTAHFHGRVTDLIDTVPADENTPFYLCGYNAMTDQASRLLYDRGIDPARIHTEVFFDSKPLTWR